MDTASEFHLLTVLQLPEGPERAEALKQLFEDRPELRQLYETGYYLQEVSGAPPSPSAMTISKESPSVVNAQSPEWIGRYRLVKPLGSGGFGIVYEAEQEEPLRRKVALKIIKPGMDTTAVIARFESERQALALMEHPNVARVLDAGKTDQGRPFFVMELVQGLQIATYCEQKKLSLKERLKLFCAVCQGVHHAHLKGIIHRDIKPSNVLVIEHDGQPVPKVIDFGIAKALGTTLIASPVQTIEGEMMGTPLYMSPEQVAENKTDIDARTDVYSLGALLYELLVGVTPLEAESFIDADQDKVRSLIRETDPVRPSQRFLRLPDFQRKALLQNRQTDQQGMLRELQGELDWIVLQALRKDRRSRYDSATTLAAEIQRYLNNEPVLARPPSASYFLRKLFLRHRFWFISAALILFSLLLGTLAAVSQAVRATVAEQTALIERDNARTAEQLATRALYATDVRRASDALKEQDVTRMQEALAEYIPLPKEPDYRGFEWYFLWNQATHFSTQLWAASLPVHHLLALPEGQLAACGADGRIRVFESSSGSLLMELNAGQGELNGLAVSPDGKWLVSCGDDGTVVLRDRKSLQTQWRVAAHTELAFQAVFTPDGSKLLTCGNEAGIKVWDVRTGDLLETVPTTGVILDGISLGANGLVTLSARGHQGDWSPWCYDITHWQPLIKSSEPAKRTTTISASGHLLAESLFPGIVKIYDSSDNSEPLVIWAIPDSATTMAFSTDERWLVAGDSSGAIHLLDLTEYLDPQSRTTPADVVASNRFWQAHRSLIYSLTFSQDSGTLYSASRDGKILAWRMNTGPLLEKHSDQGILSIGFHPRGGLLTLREHELSWQDGSEVRTLAPPAGKKWHTLSTCRYNDKILATCWGSGEVYSISLDLSKALTLWIAEQTTANTPPAICMAGHFLAVIIDPPRGGANSSGPGKLALLIDLQQSREVLRVPVADNGRVCFDPTGGLLAIITERRVHLIDCGSAAIMGTLAGHATTIRNMDFSPDGRLLATVSTDRTVRLYDVRSGEYVWNAVAHKKAATGVRFSPDGLTLATAGTDGVLRFWRTDSRRLALEVPLSGPAGEEIGFSPDGRELVVLVDQAGYVVLRTAR
jgi:serine/threonine protein kinase/WD40 repeat protein